MKFISFLFKNFFDSLISKLIELLLKYIYGIKIGKNFYISEIPILKIKGDSKKIQFGNNVKIMGKVDLRNRENGSIVFRNNVTIDNDCRFVASRNSLIEIGENSHVGCQAVWNSGEDILVGKNCVFAARSSINSNDHGKKKGINIRSQDYSYAPVNVSDDCWIGINVTILKGVKLGKGSIVGAHAVVTKDTDEYSINAGIPAKSLGYRE